VRNFADDDAVDELRNFATTNLRIFAEDKVRRVGQRWTRIANAPPKRRVAKPEA